MLQAQDTYLYAGKGIGIHGGISLALGTHFQRAGFSIQLIYISDRFQSNTCVQAYCNLRSPGPRIRHGEIILSQGIVGAFGNRYQYANYFHSPVSNQTGYGAAISYAYNLYFNKVRTTQQTGMIAFSHLGITFITENDILARPMLDRFRTAAFLLQYQYQDIAQFGVSCALWTGQMGKRQQTAHPEVGFGCYMDTTGGRYTNISHGLLSAQASYYLGYGQIVRINAGTDDERVRNTLQNKFVHDMPILRGKKKKPRNCHIPMVDQNGQQFLYLPGQVIRKPKAFLNAFTNPTVFY